MKKFSVGDKLHFRKDLKVGNTYGKLDWLNAMSLERYIKEEVTVAGFSDTGNLYLEEDHDAIKWWFSPEMFEEFYEQSELDKFNADSKRPKHKEGDRVRVRSDLKENCVYGNDVFVADMARHAGKIVTIERVVGNVYEIKENFSWFKYHWTDEMFEDGTISDDTDEDNPFDCSLAEEALYNGRLVCVDTDDTSVIERGDIVSVKNGRFEWDGQKFDHVFGVSCVIFGFNEVFDASVEFVRVMEES